MCKNPRSHGEAGFTLVELMIATAVFAGSIVMLVGGMVTLTTHNTLANDRARATTFNRSALEDLRGRTLDEILNYSVPVDDPNVGTVTIPGIGVARPTMFALLPDGAGGIQLFQLGVDDPATVVNPPNPIEIRVVLDNMGTSTTSPQVDGGGHIQYATSTRIAY